MFGVVSIRGWARSPSATYALAVLALTESEISALFDRYGPMVYRLARRILGSHEDGEEAAQEVFIRAITASDAFENRSQVSTWLYKITTNYCLNRIRGRDRRRELFEQHVVLPARDANDQPAHEKMILMRRLLAECDEQMAQAAVYVHINGMSHLEASKLLGVSRRTVGNLLDRFAEFARERLSDEESDHGD